MVTLSNNDKVRARVVGQNASDAVELSRAGVYAQFCGIHVNNALQNAIASTVLIRCMHTQYGC